jgi:hypothetical protein
MPSVTLTSCLPVLIYPGLGDLPPQNVILDVEVGGAGGDGLVQVNSNWPPVPVGSCPTGNSLDTPLEMPGTFAVFLHYQAGPDKPLIVEVEFSILVS